MRWRLVFGVLLLLGGVGAVAYAQTECPLRSARLEALKMKYKEGVVMGGIMADGMHILEITASASNTWSALVTNKTTLRACMVAYGFDFKMGKMPIAGKEL